MEQTKNLCAQIPISLHTKVRGEQKQAGQTVSQYITELLLNYYESKEKGDRMMKNSRKLAFQIPEEMFQRIKAHLAAETARTGRKLTQIILCLDNDKWGRAAAERMKTAYVQKGYAVDIKTPGHGKDWNEYLQQRVQALERGR